MTVKKLLISMLVLLPLTAHADLVAYTTNESNGRIELLDSTVPASLWNIPGCIKAHVAHVWGDGIDDIYGCWIASSDTVTVTYPGVGQRTYARTRFTFKTHPTPTSKETM